MIKLHVYVLQNSQMCPYFVTNFPQTVLNHMSIVCNLVRDAYVLPASHNICHKQHSSENIIPSIAKVLKHVSNIWPKFGAYCTWQSHAGF